MPEPQAHQARCSVAVGSASRRTLRERWLRRYQGYFGEPSALADYRAGTISFGELYSSTMKQAENMVTEAGHCDQGAFSERDL